MYLYSWLVIINGHKVSCHVLIVGGNPVVGEGEIGYAVQTWFLH